MSAADVAAYLGITVETVWKYRYPSAQTPPGFPEGHRDGRNVWYWRADVEEYRREKTAAMKVAA